MFFDDWPDWLLWTFAIVCFSIGIFLQFYWNSSFFN
ncbi:hypothetical protein JOD18_004003 [Gracilibacillus alcaliphilus]|nr:hypothetical protein [Gracilibacillus alcaliphilus]